MQYDKRGPMIGSVWPGEVVFPDFTNPKSFDYWKKQLQVLLLSEIAYSFLNNTFSIC